MAVPEMAWVYTGLFCAWRGLGFRSPGPRLPGPGLAWVWTRLGLDLSVHVEVLALATLGLVWHGLGIVRDRLASVRAGLA
jgi:hypothetical protein